MLGARPGEDCSVGPMMKKFPMLEVLTIHLGFPRCFLCPLLAALLIILLVATQPWRPPTFFLGDAASLADHFVAYQYEHPELPIRIPFGAGFVTYLEALLMFGCGAICLFVFFSLGEASEGGGWPAFFFHIGCLSVMVAGDDLFSFHEKLEALWWYGHFLLPVFFITYFSWIVLRFRGNMRSLQLGPFLLALACLGLSECQDRLCWSPQTVELISPAPWDKYQAPALIEEGLKWLGFVMWSAFFVHLAFRQLRTRVEASGK